MHLDCQQQAGLAAWVPFHESASAVTQLYRGKYVSTHTHCVFNFMCAVQCLDAWYICLCTQHKYCGDALC